MKARLTLRRSDTIGVWIQRLREVAGTRPPRPYQRPERKASASVSL
jgi:hypothetical protein